MPAPDYKEELRNSKFPVDANTRPVTILYTYDPATDIYAPLSTVGVTGVGPCLNTNIVGGVMQVENLHVVMEATGILNAAATPLRINPATEETLHDILEILGGGGGTIDRISRFDSEAVPTGGVPTVVLDYEVPPDSRFRIEAIRGWADVDAEFFVLIDALQVDGYRTTPADLTMNIQNPAIQFATAGQHIIISAAHFKVGAARTIKAVLQGSLETI